MNDSVMWRPIENDTVVPARQQIHNSNERPEYLKRQRDPGFGSVEILPDYDNDTFRIHKIFFLTLKILIKESQPLMTGYG
ncbi:Hypothetical predicted protein [Octopus vulgaris]|uniref:Uncharacterized protein n=1 Tax=Octopus vulgaris TaxID=6645 RepID=A0AA36FGS9_OCTVU|nr:Hypothetical predicted protein [Octopus vulgaris]